MKKIIEFIVDIAIICVVALIVFPKIDSVVDEIKMNSLKVKASKLVRAADSYALQNNDNREKRFDIIDGDVITTEPSSLSYKGKIDNAVVVIDSDSHIIVCVTDGINSAYKDSEETEIKVVKNQVCNIPRTSLVLNDIDKSNEVEESNIPIGDIINKNEESPKTSVVLEESSKKFDLVFDTVSSMKNGKITVGKIVKTNGFYNKNDGGEAYYEVVKDPNLTVDSSTVIALNNGLKAKLIIENRMSLKQFGAKGDGVSDDTSIINIAFKTMKKHTLYVPTGTYMVSGAVTLHSNLTIVGDGVGSLFKAVPGMAVSTDMFKMRGSSNIIVKRIGISGNSEYNTREAGHSATDGIHLFDAWDSSNINVDEVSFIDNIYAAIRIVGATSFHVTNSKFLNVDCGVITLGSPDVTDLVIENNYFDGHQNSEPISLYGTGTYKDIYINNNTIKNKTYGSAMFLGKGTIINLTVTNNTIRDCATGIIVNGATNLIIKNNNVDNSNALADGGKGIGLGNVTNAEVANNKVRKISHDCLVVKNSTSISIHDNDFRDCGYKNDDFYFVRFSESNTDVSFYNNTVVREDNNLHKVLITCSNKQNTKIYDNNLKNGIIYLWPGSEDYIIRNNNGVKVTNRGTNNTIEP